MNQGELLFQVPTRKQDVKGTRLRRRLTELRGLGLSFRRIGEIVGMSEAGVRYQLSQAEEDADMPALSEAEIKRRCRSIQAEWTPRERAKRAGRETSSRWLPPAVTVCESE